MSREGTAKVPPFDLVEEESKLLNIEKIKTKLKKFEFIPQEGPNRKIEVTGNISQENVTGRKTLTPIANKKLHRKIESPFTTPKRRLNAPENLSTGKRCRKEGGIEMKKENLKENLKKMKVTHIVDYFETLNGELKAKKTKQDEQPKPRKLDLTLSVTGNVIGQQKAIVKTEENVSQPGRSLQNNAKLQHPIAWQRGNLRNEAGRAAHDGRADHNKA